MSYTPTTDEVRDDYAHFQVPGGAAPVTGEFAEGRAEFDRWLAALIREAKAEAWGEAADLAEGVECIVLDPVMEKIGKNVGLSLAQEFRARAAEYRKAVEAE